MPLSVPSHGRLFCLDFEPNRRLSTHNYLQTGEKNMNDRITVHSCGGNKERKITLKVGKEYVVQPLNIRKKKHRDRPCILLDFVPVSEDHPRDIVAKVRFLD